VSGKDIINNCQNLYKDLELTYVKDWKDKNNAKAIGFMPVYIPREIIHAAGMLPVGIMGAGDNLEIIRGDAYFQSYICHIPRSTIELGLSGKLDCLDGMLFPAICDVIRNLSGMSKLIFKDKYIKYMDLPQNFKAEIGGAFYYDELKNVCHDFEQLIGNKITDDALRNSIQLYNQNKKVIDRLYALRSQHPHVVSSYELYLLLRASNILEVSEHTELVEQFLTEVVKEKHHQMDNIKVVLSGLFCEQPPLGLIKAIEQSGCYIVDDDWVLVSRYIQKDIKEDGNPLNSLVEAYLQDGSCTASRYIDDQQKGEYLVDSVKANKADGVIFISPSFCDPALLDRPMLQVALSKENIPFTFFNFAENSGQFQVIKEQTGTFSDSIKLWGEV